MPRLHVAEDQVTTGSGFFSALFMFQLHVYDITLLYLPSYTTCFLSHNYKNPESEFKYLKASFSVNEGHSRVSAIQNYVFSTIDGTV